MRGAARGNSVADDGRLPERAEQFRLLSEGLAGVASSSRGRVVLVPGEAGIGKTALLRWFCASVSRSARVLWAGCDPLFTPRPLGPVAELAEVIGGEVAARARDDAKPYDLATAFLHELAAGPTVLVFDDVHWADEATLDVIRIAGRRAGDVPGGHPLGFGSGTVTFAGKANAGTVHALVRLSGGGTLSVTGNWVCSTSGK